MKADQTQTPHQLTQHTKLLQKAVLVWEDQFLVLKRAADAHSRPEKWDLPGGNSEWPEITKSQNGLHYEDLTREVSEETGVDFDANLLDQENLVYFDTYFAAEEQVFTVICGLSIDLQQVGLTERPNIKLSNEHTAYAWVSHEELDDYDFGKTGEFVKNIIQNAQKK
jgi:8-oxo-dGTP pyrophosphatase MutT (NUDIX family)